MFSSVLLKFCQINIAALHRRAAKWHMTKIPQHSHFTLHIELVCRSVYVAQGVPFRMTPGLNFGNIPFSSTKDKHWLQRTNYLYTTYFLEELLEHFNAAAYWSAKSLHGSHGGSMEDQCFGMTHGRIWLPFQKSNLQECQLPPFSSTTPLQLPFDTSFWTPHFHLCPLSPARVNEMRDGVGKMPCFRLCAPQSRFQCVFAATLRLCSSAFYLF